MIQQFFQDNGVNFVTIRWKQGIAFHTFKQINENTLICVEHGGSKKAEKEGKRILTRIVE